MNPQTFIRRRGPWQQHTRNGHRVLFADGRIRAVEITGEPDTFFSQPARARHAGKWYTGYITGDDNSDGTRQAITFRPHTDQGTPPAWKWPDASTPEHDRIFSNIAPKEPQA